MLNYFGLVSLFTYIRKKHEIFKKENKPFKIEHGFIEKILTIVIIIAVFLGCFFSIYGSSYTTNFQLMPNLST
jgi:disulfide bond formation protein DsbB